MVRLGREPLFKKCAGFICFLLYAAPKEARYERYERALLLRLCSGHTVPDMLFLALEANTPEGMWLEPWLSPVQRDHSIMSKKTITDHGGPDAK